MLKWSQAGAGNWNGKAGTYTMMVVAFHEGEGWWLHPKLPGLHGQMVKNPSEGRTIANRLFSEWLQAIGVDHGPTRPI
jgi:hypothetical protein